MIQLEFATVASILSIILMTATLIGLAIKAGERREAMNQMKREIDELWRKHGAADEQAREDGKTLSSIQATLVELVKAVDSVRLAFMAHVGEK